MVLVNLNIERQRQGLDPIIPWANNEGTHPSHNVGSNEEITVCHITDVPDHLSHMSLEDGVLRKVNDSSMSWQEHALIHDAPGEEFSLNNLAIFQEEPHAITSAIGDNLSLLYPNIPSFLIPRELPMGGESMNSIETFHTPTSSPTSSDMSVQNASSMVLSHPSFPIDHLAALESMDVPVPFGEGSSRSVENQNLPSPVHAEEEEDVVRNFWTMGETPKYIIHP